MDDRLKWNNEYVGWLQEWGRKVSKLPTLKVTVWEKVPNGYQKAFAWCHIKGKIVVFNNDAIINDTNSVGYMKTALLHEMGHIFNVKRRGCATEYKAQEWAMRKCCKLGLETQLWYLKYQVRVWGESEIIRQWFGDRYYNAYKWFKKKSIV